MHPTIVDSIIITINATNLSLRFLKVFMKGTHIVTIRNHIAPDINFRILFPWSFPVVHEEFTVSKSFVAIEFTDPCFNGFKTFSAVAERKDFSEFNASPVKCPGVLCRASDINSNYQS